MKLGPCDPDREKGTEIAVGFLYYRKKNNASFKLPGIITLPWVSNALDTEQAQNRYVWKEYGFVDSGKIRKRIYLDTCENLKFCSGQHACSKTKLMCVSLGFVVCLFQKKFGEHSFILDLESPLWGMASNSQLWEFPGHATTEQKISGLHVCFSPLSLW